MKFVLPIDKEALRYWKDYSEARNEMLSRTNFRIALWFVVSADNKDMTHIALISHLLKQLKYHNKNKKILSHNYDLVFQVTPKNIKEKLF